MNILRGINRADGAPDGRHKRRDKHLQALMVLLQRKPHSAVELTGALKLSEAGVYLLLRELEDRGVGVARQRDERYFLLA